MILIDNKLISEDIIEKQFVCDLAKCKGGCCEDGDAGAPLEDEELQTVLDSYEKITPYLSAAAIREIERKGKYVYNKEFGWVTPTLGSDKEICVYGFRDERGLIKCAFEQAYLDGVIPFKKPISCHLYPIIANKGKQGGYETVNYEPRESLCRPACGLGKKLKVRTYEFLKEPLTRRYGQEFYNLLDKIAKKKQQEREAKEIKATAINQVK
ncbi:MAG: DUF3109 family protein [Chitinophagaceae bacterium]|nr:DUF3109 family protein [Chitinophagaceae bacterium]